MSEYRISFYVTDLTLETVVAADSMEDALKRADRINFWTLLAPDTEWVDSTDVVVDGVWKVDNSKTEPVEVEPEEEMEDTGTAPPLDQDAIVASMVKLLGLLEAYEASLK